MNIKQTQADVSIWEAKVNDFKRQLDDATQKLKLESDAMGQVILDGADATMVSEKVALAENRKKGVAAALSLANQGLVKARAALADAQKEEGQKKIARLKAEHLELVKEVVAKYVGLLDHFDVMIDLQREITQTQSAFSLPVQIPEYGLWAQDGVAEDVRNFFSESEMNHPGLWARLGMARPVIKRKFLRTTAGIAFVDPERAPDADE